MPKNQDLSAHQAVPTCQSKPFELQHIGSWADQPDLKLHLTPEALDIEQQDNFELFDCCVQQSGSNNSNPAFRTATHLYHSNNQSTCEMTPMQRWEAEQATEQAWDGLNHNLADNDPPNDDKGIDKNKSSAMNKSGMGRGSRDGKGKNRRSTAIRR